MVFWKSFRIIPLHFLPTGFPKPLTLLSFDLPPHLPSVDSLFRHLTPPTFDSYFVLCKACNSASSSDAAPPCPSQPLNSWSNALRIHRPLGTTFLSVYQRCQVPWCRLTIASFNCQGRPIHPRQMGRLVLQHPLGFKQSKDFNRCRWHSFHSGSRALLGGYTLHEFYH